MYRSRLPPDGTASICPVSNIRRQPTTVNLWRRQRRNFFEKFLKGSCPLGNPPLCERGENSNADFTNHLVWFGSIDAGGAPRPTATHAIRRPGGYLYRGHPPGQVRND